MHLTYRDTKPSVEADIANVEITPEMARAGVSAYLAHDPRFSSDEEAVVAVFRAMLRAKSDLSGR